MSSRKVVTMRGATQVVLEDPSTLDQSGPASASAAKGHKFSFDYAYSSHDPGDPSFVNQGRDSMHLKNIMKNITKIITKVQFEKETCVNY